MTRPRTAAPPRGPPCAAGPRPGAGMGDWPVVVAPGPRLEVAGRPGDATRAMRTRWIATIAAGLALGGVAPASAAAACAGADDAPAAANLGAVGDASLCLL